VKRDFENKLRALQVSMVVEVQAILAPFLAFTYSYNVNKAHNMLALILDLWFKSLNAVKSFVGWAKMIQIVVEYDNKTLLPLLVASFHFLNPTIDGLIDDVTLVDDDSIFGAMTSNVTTLHMLKNELSLFCYSHVKPKGFIVLLTWWKSHETPFPNVSSLAW
jgi:hypothetical protein